MVKVTKHTKQNFPSAKCMEYFVSCKLKEKIGKFGRKLTETEIQAYRSKTQIIWAVAKEGI